MGDLHDEEDSVYGNTRLNLLQIIEDRNRTLNKKSLLHRLVYVAKLHENLHDKRDLGSNTQNVMDSLHQKVPDLLIPQDLLGYLLNSLDLCSPDQFLNKYDEPFDVILDQELVWPLPTKTFPIHR
ncbi:hypothetical protein BSL78_20728 [Apostichopus japonicus]|uniref:Uncharacterized protein n=1 Tax=Stichopus japonicus TaxID=307972 RepID=A0A2G8K352_STIJA|nr:hypothetical protein BSL78_20728 [Apostichopus japonicus]